jgi:hypothetical protein
LQGITEPEKRSLLFLNVEDKTKFLAEKFEKQIELRNNIIKEFDKIYDKLLESKQQKNTELVVMKDKR